mmetsp:Transcript_1960/g.5807  ORF Transcript_1960/g.5807 Transcript_1960/m.5807 type:complete len:80 (+) Transcript_1960:482-721(+)
MRRARCQSAPSAKAPASSPAPSAQGGVTVTWAAAAVTALDAQCAPAVAVAERLTPSDKRFASAAGIDEFLSSVLAINQG